MDEDKEIFKRAIRRMAADRFDISGSLETSAEMIADAASSAADALKHVEQSTAAVTRSLARLNKKRD